MREVLHITYSRSMNLVSSVDDEFTAFTIIIERGKTKSETFTPYVMVEMKSLKVNLFPFEYSLKYAELTLRVSVIRNTIKSYQCTNSSEENFPIR